MVVGKSFFSREINAEHSCIMHITTQIEQKKNTANSVYETFKWEIFNMKNKFWSCCGFKSVNCHTFLTITYITRFKCDIFE